MLSDRYLGPTDTEKRLARINSVTKDATSGIRWPSSSAEWLALGYKAPLNLYNCQDLSGDLVDTIANQNLTAAGTPTYNNATTGWSRKGVSFTETSAQGFYVADATTTPHPQTDSVTYFGYFKFSSTTSNRITISLSGLNLYLQLNNIGTLHIVVQGQTNVDGVYNYKDGAVHPLIFRYNWATQTVKIITDKEILTSTFRTAALTSGTHGFNSATTVPPVCTMLGLALFYGDGAEMIGADTLVELGWTLAYSASTDSGQSMNTTLVDTTGGGLASVKMLLPAGYKHNRSTGPYPLVLFTHQYGGTYSVLVTGMNILAIKDLNSGYMVIPAQGKVDSFAKQFWNANAAGCDLDHTNPDHKNYLRSLLQQALRLPNVDTKRVYVVGESNGAAMAVELGMNSDDIICSVFAAAAFISTAETPAQAHGKPVNYLIQAQTGDPTVLYAGSSTTPNPFTGTYKGQLTMVDNLAAANAAAGGTTAGSLQTAYDTVDLITDIAGNETSRQAYSGMPANGAVEHWSNAAAVHIPAWTNFLTTVFGWLDSHPRP